MWVVGLDHTHACNRLTGVREIRTTDQFVAHFLSCTTATDNPPEQNPRLVLHKYAYFKTFQTVRATFRALWVYDHTMCPLFLQSFCSTAKVWWRTPVKSGRSYKQFVSTQRRQSGFKQKKGHGNVLLVRVTFVVQTSLKIALRLRHPSCVLSFPLRTIPITAIRRSTDLFLIVLRACVTESEKLLDIKCGDFFLQNPIFFCERHKDDLHPHTAPASCGCKHFYSTTLCPAELKLHDEWRGQSDQLSKCGKTPPPLRERERLAEEMFSRRGQKGIRIKMKQLKTPQQIEIVLYLFGTIQFS